ncbi:MAG: kynureninase, partial [Luminiphilus sp.]|nr:kynureninase [Luminiphilus sp.]
MQSAEDLDLADSLSSIRRQFDLPTDKIYLDGNSLGALSTAVKRALTKTVDQEWGNDLIESWNSHD